MADLIKKLHVSPTLLRVVRVFRVGRVLRLVKSAKGIRTLLFSLAVSMPALFNIGLLLFLIMFIYAVFGMGFFMNVRHTAGIDDMFNFESFDRGMIILFQTCTSAGWDGVLAGLLYEEPDCNANATTTTDSLKPTGYCGGRALVIVYLVTYLVISFLVIINMYIAVILENFSQATEDVEQGLTQDDFDMYYEVWERFDESASQFVPLVRLTEFVDALEAPLRLPAPNYFKLIQLDIPIYDGDRVHCVDILDALTKNFLGTTSAAAGELGDVKKGPEMAAYRVVDSTMQRRRAEFCARLIQSAWRSHVEWKKSERERRLREAEESEECVSIDEATPTHVRRPTLEDIPEQMSLGEDERSQELDDCR